VIAITGAVDFLIGKKKSSADFRDFNRLDSSPSESLRTNSEDDAIAGSATNGGGSVKISSSVGRQPSVWIAAVGSTREGVQHREVLCRSKLEHSAPAATAATERGSEKIARAVAN
jgi:hypothetical protein